MSKFADHAREFRSNCYEYVIDDIVSASNSYAPNIHLEDQISVVLGEVAEAQEAYRQFALCGNKGDAERCLGNLRTELADVIISATRSLYGACGYDYPFSDTGEVIRAKCQELHDRVKERER